MSQLKKIIKLLFLKFTRSFKQKEYQKFDIKFIEDVPDNIDDSVVYIIGENGYYWSAMLQCPCNCGSKIQLPLLKDAYPFWEFKHHNDGSISLFPSVWRQVGCSSHFFIKKSKVIWADG